MIKPFWILMTQEMMGRGTGISWIMQIFCINVHLALDR